MFSDDIIIRVTETAKYVVSTGATVRNAAKKFNISKSTVHKDLSQRLQHIDGELYKKASAVLKQNRDERHIRGGLATKRKYGKII